MILQLCNLTHILERNRRLSVWSTHCSPGGAKLESLNKGDGSDNASSNMTINNYNEISIKIQKSYEKMTFAVPNSLIILSLIIIFQNSLNLSSRFAQIKD